MPAKLKYYAFKEIQYAYYYDLINPLTGYPSKISSYPKDALDTIEAFGKAFNDNDLLDHCLLFKLVLRDYALYYPFAWSPTSALPNDEKNYIVVRERVAWYDSYLKGEAKNYAMVNLMQFISQFNDKSDFELAFSHYDSLHSNAGILAIRDSLNHLVNQIGSISAKELLQLMVEDTTHHKTSLRTYFIKKLTLIDCWATWCAPCKRQMPFLAAIAAEFKDKVTFISLSANQMLPKWNDWMLKNGDILSPNIIQAHAPGGFNHPFFKRLMVSSIPRYILVSQEGEILNRSMPNPEDKAAFINELNHYFEEVSHI
jgi:thiol-disulfide isomerase/thioredoxin